MMDHLQISFAIVHGCGAVMFTLYVLFKTTFEVFFSRNSDSTAVLVSVAFKKTIFRNSCPSFTLYVLKEKKLQILFFQKIKST